MILQYQITGVNIIDVMLESLGSNRQGLDMATAAERLRQNGRNTFIADHGRSKALELFLNQFRSPLVLILIFAAIIALIVQDCLDASIVLGIVLLTAVLSFIQEYRATGAVEKLRRQISIRSTVLRDGQTQLIPIRIEK